MKSDEGIHYNSRKLVTDRAEIKRIDDMARFIEEDIAQAKNPSQTKTKDQPTPSSLPRLQPKQPCPVPPARR